MGNKNDRFYKGKPKLGGRRGSKYHQGIYKPVNKSKYIGDVENVVYRSGLELKMYKFFDLHPSILEWKCEETVIPYISPVDNRTHRYFVDVFIKYRTKKNEVKTCIIEIKPFSEVKPPEKTGKKTKSFVYQVQTYLVNEAKWNAASEYAVSQGWEFKILTEQGFCGWKVTKQ